MKYAFATSAPLVAISSWSLWVKEAAQSVALLRYSPAGGFSTRKLFVTENCASPCPLKWPKRGERSGHRRGWPPRRPLMNDRDSDRGAAIRQIAAILAAAYLRLRFPEP